LKEVAKRLHASFLVQEEGTTTMHSNCFLRVDELPTGIGPQILGSREYRILEISTASWRPRKGDS